MRMIEQGDKKQQIDGYWFVIFGLLTAVSILFIVHLQTGYTPPREAFTIPVLNVPVYWYGIWIVGGIGLGAYVISRLAQEQMLAVFAMHVPATVQSRAITTLNLSEDVIETLLHKSHIETLGDLLLVWGANPKALKLRDEDASQVQEALRSAPDVAAAWLDDAPWHAWYPEHVWNALIVVMVWAVIGARLYHVFTPSPSMAAFGIYSPMDYFRNPIQLINIRNGGLGIYGGLAGGLLGLWLYTRRQRIPLLMWTDLAAIGVSLGQVFGRWGNFFNQELYGRPTNLPWAITIDPAHRLPAYAQFEQFHPAFLYESLWSLLTFGVLWFLLKKSAIRLKTGELTAFYLIFYAIGRILLETVRLDSRTAALGAGQLNLAVATWVSIGVALVMGIWVLWGRFVKGPKGLVSAKSTDSKENP